MIDTFFKLNVLKTQTRHIILTNTCFIPNMFPPTVNVFKIYWDFM